MPSSPILQAWAKTVGPSPSICSLKRRPRPALASILRSVALCTSSGSRRRSSPFSSIRSKVWRKMSLVSAVVPDEIERSHTVVIAGDSFAVDDAGARAQAGQRLKRSQAEVSGILSAIEAKVAALAHDPFVQQRRIRIRAIGRLDILPESVVAAIRTAEAATTQNNSMALTVAVAYGGREEITDAVRALLKTEAQRGAALPEAIERITPEAIARHLYAADLPDPDLIIRTSGEIRLSGFLLWQSVHSEFYFTDVLWPAFRKVDFLRAIRAYQARNRRFGR